MKKLLGLLTLITYLFLSCQPVVNKQSDHVKKNKEVEKNALVSFSHQANNFLVAGKLAVSFEDDKLVFWDTLENERLLIADPALLVPEINLTPTEIEFQRIEQNDSTFVLHFNTTSTIEDFILTIQSHNSHLEIFSAFTMLEDGEMNKLQVLPQNTKLNFYEAVNIRNRQNSDAMWPELNVGGPGFETTTNSTDWQFAPHSSMITLKKDDAQLLMGALDIPKAFGLYMKVHDYRNDYMYLNYGQKNFGLKLTEGERFESPHFAFVLNHTLDFYSTLTKYTDILVKEDYIPAPSAKKTYDWHKENLYCTWIDQNYRSNTKLIAELSEQEKYNLNSKTILDEQFVREAAEIIKKENLPFTTILIDEGMSIACGDWEVHPERFPDFRQLVDDLHEMGFKVIIWWNWAELDNSVEVDEKYLIAGGKKNRHGKRMRDYSLPETREEYLKPLLYKFFSADSGCYNVDGIKTDFQADKVHDDMPVHDPEWRGEENYFYHLYEYFYNLMKEYKPDACHIGCSGHPYLAQFIDINRTYDVMNSNAYQHLNRAIMLKNSTLNTPVAFDFHNYLENIELYFHLAKENDFSIQIGNIMGVKDDHFSDWREAGPDYYEFLRKELPKFE